MRFMSDNAASVHPKVWEALRAADGADSPYDGDALSQRLDARFSELFGREATVLWVATGTAANCLALAPMCPPHGGVVCHREAHIEMDEGGAPGFYLHGAKLLLAGRSDGGDGAKLTPQTIRDVIDPIRDDVHQVQPHAISITQASEYGRVYRPEEIAAISQLARERGLALHMDGARFANATAFLGGSAAEAAGDIDALSFGCVKNGGMSAEAIVFFDPALADVARYRRKRAGHLQSKGRFLAAQLLAMVENDLWLDNARAANAAAQAIAERGDRRPEVYKTKESLKDAWYEVAKEVDAKIGPLFLRQPETPLRIEPYEPYREQFFLAASYQPGEADGSRPGTFYFSGWNAAERELSPSIRLYMHEGNPGHHFQVMFAVEDESLPDLLRHGWFTAYGEGWALYAESLGYELGLYDDPVDRLQALEDGELKRAVRLVVDTGMHALGWSREQAIEYMVANGAARDFAESESARYIVMPAQALAYKTGELKIKQLRARAEAALGEDFDVRAFHEQVLNTGDIPLPVLEAKIDAWIAGGGQ